MMGVFRQSCLGLLWLCASAHSVYADDDVSLPEWHLAMRYSPEFSQSNPGSSFQTPFNSREGSTFRIEWQSRFRYERWNGQALLRHRWPQSDRPELITQELYYDGDLTPQWGFTLGKKVMSWGVGFGFRPLDVIQQENRRTANPLPLNGVPLLAVSHFHGSDALTMAWANPGDGAGTGQNAGQSLAVHHYHLSAEGDDWHHVLRVSEREQLQVGMGLTRIVGEEWSVHAASLWQARHYKTLNTLTQNTQPLVSPTNPMLEQAYGSIWKSVLGIQWAGSSGVSVLLEGWFDGSAYRSSDWRALQALTAQQRAILSPDVTLGPGSPANTVAILGNIAWSSQAYQAANLRQDNLLLRLSYDDTDGFRPYAEILLNPSDSGKASTLGATYEQGAHRLTLGWRQLSGPSQSALGQAPTKQLFWLEWRWALF